MRDIAVTLVMLSGLSLSVTQDAQAQNDTSTALTGEEVEEPEGSYADALHLELPGEPLIGEVVTGEPGEEERREDFVPSWRRNRPSSTPITLSRDARYRRELNYELEKNSLTLPLAMFFGGAAGAVGFGYGAITCHTSEEYDPTVGEVRCTEFTTLNVAFLLLAVACNSITIGGAIMLIIRGVYRRAAYREYRARTRLSLNPGGLELRF